jgi:hypothetical protein
MSALSERIDNHQEMIGMLIEERELTQKQLDRELDARNKLEKIKDEAENHIKYGRGIAITATSLSEFKRFMAFFTEHAEEVKNENTST